MGKTGMGEEVLPPGLIPACIKTDAAWLTKPRGNLLCSLILLDSVFWEEFSAFPYSIQEKQFQITAFQNSVYYHFEETGQT